MSGHNSILTVISALMLHIIYYGSCSKAISSRLVAKFEQTNRSKPQPGGDIF